MSIFIRGSTALVFTLLLAAAGCSGGGGGSSGTNYVSRYTTNCVTIPKEKESSVAWTFEDCGPYNIGDTLHFHNDWEGQVPSGSSYTTQAIGTMPIDKGHVTFKYKDFDWNDMNFPPKDVVVVALMVQNQDQTSLVGDWHVLVNRFGMESNVETRIVTQRFDDICIPETIRWCEKKDQAYDKPMYDRSRTYRFDCSWDTTVPSMLYGQGSGVKDGLVQCDIYDSTEPAKETLISSYKVPTSGPYPALDTFVVGGRSGQVFKAYNMYNIMTDVRITIFK